MGRALDRLLDACRAKGLQPTKTRGPWYRIPHPCSPQGDSPGSFVAMEAPDGTVFVDSHKPSYTKRDALLALGLDFKDCFVEDDRNLKFKDKRGRSYTLRHAYEYTDVQGRPKGRVGRAYPDDGEPGRQFPQWHYDEKKNLRFGLNGVPLPLYLLPLVRSSIAEGLVIYLVEGEKDARSMWCVGFAATSSPGGCECPWYADWSNSLSGADVVIVADKDYGGYKAAKERKAQLSGIAASVSVVEAAAGKDASDHLAAGLTPRDFVQLSDFELDARIEQEFAKVQTEKLRKRSEQMSREPDRYGRIVALDEVKPLPIDWMMYPYFAKGFTHMVDGEKGIGKSFFLLALAAGITVGKLPGVQDFEPGNVLILASEDPIEYVISPRLLHAMPNGADMTKIKVLDDCPSFDRDGFESLETRVADLKPLLVIVDMLFGFTGDIEVNSDPAAKACMRELNRISSAYQCGTFLSRHPVKNWRERDYTHRGMGSQGWGGGARLGFWVEEKEDEPGVRIAMHIKANISPELGRPLRFTLSKDSGFEWDGYDAMPKGTVGSRGPSAEKMKKAKAALIKLLANATMDSKEAVAAACSMSGAGKSTVYSAAKELDLKGDQWTIESDPFGDGDDQ